MRNQPAAIARMRTSPWTANVNLSRCVRCQTKTVKTPMADNAASVLHRSASARSFGIILAACALLSMISTIIVPLKCGVRS